MHCITLIGGIPGSGKTALINYIKQNRNELFASKNVSDSTETACSKNFDTIPAYSIHVIAIDDLCSLEDQAKIVQTMTGWRHFRVQLLEAAERYICQTCNIVCNFQGPLTLCSSQLLEKISFNNSPMEQTGLNYFFIEDNFYYKSMRYAWFQLAKRGGLGFCQVHLTCSLDIAVERNSLRYQKIPQPLIQTMFSTMEYPDPDKNKWENFSINLDSAQQLNHQFVSPIINLITKAEENPVKTVSNEKMVKDQIICSTNVVHQADKILRYLAGAVIKKLKAMKCICVSKDVIMQIIDYRHEVLSDLREGILCVPTQSTIDTNPDLELILQKAFFKKCTKIINLIWTLHNTVLQNGNKVI